jgi:BMFP domain-containing protein YqiC
MDRTAVVRQFLAIASTKGRLGADRLVKSDASMAARSEKGAMTAPAGHPALAFALIALYSPGEPNTADTMDPRFIDELARRLSAAVPQGLTAVRRDLEDNFKAVLQAGLAKLDLVTRQEFDVQAGVLRRTREKLEALEARLAAFEKDALPASRSPT